MLGRASEIYAINYFGVIIVVSLLECVVPRRAAAGTLRLRWFGNFALSILDTILVRALFPVVGLGWALFCAERGWGLFNNVSLPRWVSFVLTIGILDLVYYVQHNVLHRVPVLWTLHRAHHTDHDMDFSTAARFHPIESLFTTMVVMAAIALLGAPPAAVFVSQLLTSALTFLEHGNLRLPESVNQYLHLAFVTPDMHRVHHSQDVRETNTNFGTVFPWWDRIFGTYLERPAADEAGFTYGVAEFRDPKHQMLPWMLAQPFLHADPGPAESAGAGIAETGAR
jgi:sterol desaturase/sphingolipid hydroxylase (fatty acid hydroxylase superfamily)